MSKARDLSDFISDATVDATEIADLAVTHAKLHTDMNLSSKTLTFAANQISGNSVDGGVISNFASTGIDDNASSTAFIITSGGDVEVRDSGMLKVYRAGNSAYAGLFLDSGEKLYIRNSWASKDIVMLRTGEVGIGTDNPDQPLVVNSSSGGSTVKLIGRSADNISSLTFANAGNTASNYIQGNSSFIRARADSGFHFRKGGTPETTDSSGFTIQGLNVGIGTPTPARPLNIVNDAGANPIQSIRNSNTAWSQYALTRYGTEGEDVRYMDFGYYRGSSEPTRGLVIKSQANATLVTFLDSGNVGIGTTNPLEKLQVNFTSTETYQSTLTRNTNTPGAWVVNLNNDDNMSGLHLATGSGTHFSSIVGARTANASHWGTHLAFYTHRNDTANVNTADERMRLDGSGSLEQYGSSVKSMYFPVFLESGQTHHIATATNLANSTVVIATLEFASLYAYAGSQHSMGTIWASARRTNNNTAWRELNQATVNIGDTGYTPGFYWDTSNGQLKCTVGGSVQVTGFIRITYHACDITRVTN